MNTINPYLTFDGNCEEAFSFYKSVFGGEYAHIGRFGDMPAGEWEISDEESKKIMHVSLPISKETILMGSDSSATFGQTHKMGDNISLSVNTESKDEAFRIFEGLSAGGKVTMPMDKTFWGAWFGMFIDKFGIHWMVNFDESPQK